MISKVFLTDKRQICLAMAFWELPAAERRRFCHALSAEDISTRGTSWCSVASLATGGLAFLETESVTCRR